MLDKLQRGYSYPSKYRVTSGNHLYSACGAAARDSRKRWLNPLSHDAQRRLVRSCARSSWRIGSLHAMQMPYLPSSSCVSARLKSSSLVSLLNENSASIPALEWSKRLTASGLTSRLYLVFRWLRISVRIIRRNERLFVCIDHLSSAGTPFFAFAFAGERR